MVFLASSGIIANEPFGYERNRSSVRTSDHQVQLNYNSHALVKYKFDLPSVCNLFGILYKSEFVFFLQETTNILIK